MSLLDKIFTLGRQKDLIEIDNTEVGFFGALEGIRSNDLITNRDDIEMAKFYRSWSKVAIDKIAKKVAMVNFKIKKYSDGEEVENHEFIKLLRRPNALMSKAQFLGRIVRNKLLYGKAPVHVIGLNKPKELRPISPINFKARWNEGKTDIKGYGYGHSGKTKFDTEEIIYISEYHPIDPADATSPTRAYLYGIETMLEMENWAYMFFSSGGIPPFSIIYEEKLSRVVVDEIKERFKQEYMGSNNSFQPMVMSGGAKIQKTGLSPKDIDLSSTEMMARDKVLAQFGVPKGVAGLVDDVNRANLEASILNFLINTIEPEVQAICDDLNMYIGRVYGEDFYITYDNFIPADKKTEAETRQIRGKWMLIDELREEEGKEPLPNGRGQRLVDEPIFDAKAEKQYQKLQAKIEMLSMKGFESKEQKEESLKKWLEMKALTKEEKLVESIRKYTKGLRKRLISNLKSTKSYSLKKGIESIFDDKTEVNYLFDLLKVFYDYAGKQAVDEAIALLDIDDYDPIIDLAQAYETMLSKSSARIGNTIKQWIIEDLLIGLERGEGIEELTQRILNISDYIDEHHAFTIAQTETTKVSNYTYFETYKQGGAPYKKWIDLGDSRVRESHQNVQPTRMDRKFDVGGSKMDFPGDPNGNAEDVIGCRCRVLPEWELDEN